MNKIFQVPNFLKEILRGTERVLCTKHKGQCYGHKLDESLKTKKGNSRMTIQLW